MIGAGAAFGSFGLGAGRCERGDVGGGVFGGFEVSGCTCDRGGKIGDDGFELPLREFLAGEFLPEEAVTEADSPDCEKKVEREGD